MYHHRCIKNKYIPVAFRPVFLVIICLLVLYELLSMKHTKKKKIKNIFIYKENKMNDDSMSQITLPKSLRQKERYDDLLEDNKNIPYKVFVTDSYNNIIWDIDDALYRMFANTLEEVDEFLTLLFVKYGPMKHYYVYDTYAIYVNRSNSHLIRHPSLNSSVVHQNKSINELLQNNKLPGKIFKVKMFGKFELKPEEEILYSQISSFIPSSYDMSQFLGKGKHVQYNRQNL